MPFVDTGEVSLYYEEYGSGRPIVFLHGLTLDRRMWRRQIEFFSRTYRVVVYDARGHGRSSCPETGYSRAHRVEDLWRLVTHLKLDRFHLVGLSMGGATALGYAIDHQDTLQSLTLVDSSAGGFTPPPKFRDMREVARTEGVEEAKRRWVRTTLFYYANRNEELRRELGEIMADHCGRIWLDPGRGRYQERDDVSLSATVTVPTLIFVGAKDRYFLPLAKTLHQNIAGSEMVVVPDAGHMLNMEAPELFNFRLQQFLDRVDARSAIGS